MATMRFLFLRGLAVFALCLSAFSTMAHADEITVMCSGGFTSALKQLAPAFEKSSGHKVNIVLGPSMGTSEAAIPSRLQRGEPADLLIMVGYSLESLAKSGLVEPSSIVPLVDSKIGLIVKSGHPKPDISNLDAFKKTLLAAQSIAYSDSASGRYIEQEMYKKLGLEDQLSRKSKRIVRGGGASEYEVAGAVVKGEAEIGLHQVSELLPAKGIDFVGTIPDEVQMVTVFSAGFPKAARSPAVARQFLDYLRSAAARPTIEKTGLVPAAPAAR